MNLNRIQLPAFLLADLYKHSLVTIDTGTASTNVFFSPEKADSAGDKWKYLGENKKNILVVVSHQNAFYLPDDDLAFLTNMLTACKLNLADVAIINRNHYQDSNYKEFIAQFASRIVFLFDVDPVSFGMPVNFPQFQLQPLANATFLFTPSLEAMKKDGLLKSKLWLCLRRLFNI